MATDYVIWTNGQSNCALEGRGTGTPTALTTSAAYVLSNDGFRRLANDPVGAVTNNRYTTYTHTSAGNSYAPSMLNTIAASLLTPGDTLYLCGHGVGGTFSAAWATSATSSPPPQNALLGVSKLRMVELMRNLTNPVLLCHLIDQGESDGDTAPHAADWGPSWTTVANEVEAFATANGWTWAKTLRHVVRVLPDLAATSFPQWGTVQTNQLSWITARNGGAPNTVVSYKPPSGMTYTDGTNLHFQTASLSSPIGPGVGAVILAAA